MKACLLSLLATLFLIEGCTTAYVQLYKTASTNTINKDGIYVYENDTLGIDYRFWDDGGIVEFRIRNKSDKPLYLDLKKCTFITKDSRYEYWVDKTMTGIKFKSYSKINKSDFPNSIGFSSIAAMNVSQTKQERVIFMPPKTYIVKTTYPIVRDYIYIDKRNTDFTKRVETRNDNPKKQTSVYSKNFQKENSLVHFRNFLTFSFKEDFSTEFYTDNEFYVSEMDEMDERHFSQTVRSKNGDPIDTCKYEKSVDFYKKSNVGIYSGIY